MATMETYHGQVRTPADAIILFEACRLGILPRVQRRLSEKERQQIRSGSVFVWDEREAGMRRWTDGKSWSASRVSGSFLTYREMEGKRGGFGAGTAQKRAPAGPASKDGRDSDQEGADEGPDGYRYKPDGLMKQSFSITTHDGRHLHLISYFSRSNTGQALQLPSGDPNLRNIRPQKGMYPEATLNEANAIPPVTRGPLGGGPPAWAPVGQNAPPYPYPPPNAYIPHGYPPGPYPPPGHWPPTPSGTPGPYPYYPPPHGHHPYQYPTHAAPHYPPPPGHYGGGSTYPPPPSPSATLPPLVNGLHSPTQQHHPPHSPSNQSQNYPPSSSGPAVSALRPNPYASPHRESAPIEQTSAINGHKPPSPASAGAPVTSSAPPTISSTSHTSEAPVPASSPASSAPPSSDSQSASAPPPLAPPPSRTSATTIPSIDSLLGPTTSSNLPNERAATENGAHTPPGSRSSAGALRTAREMAHPIVAAGMDRDRNDLKRLDSQSLKFN